MTKVAVVTGGASGLGFAAASRFLRDGLRVALWDHDPVALDAAVVSLLKLGTVVAQKVDVTDPGVVAYAAEATRKTLGPISILLASAGGGGGMHSCVNYPLEQWSKVLDLNLTGAHLCCQAVLADMLDSEWGRIILVSSMAGKEGNPNMLAYSTAKAGLIGYVKSMGKELANTGVIVNGIAPTIFETPMLQAVDEVDGGALRRDLVAKIPMGRLGQPSEFGALAAWLASSECSFTTGMIFDLSGGRATY